MSLSTKATYQSQFDRHKICVLIPTYNNDGTLQSVIESVLEYTENILVVNDGSTDNTQEIIDSFTHIQHISYLPNQGKGNALKTGFRKAHEYGYEYAISIDSDGQHFAKDLPTFIETIEKNPNALVIGARNMDQSHIPGKSTFGNKFSNFWFWVETGIRLPDTQSGYRLYPLTTMAKLKYFTQKFEFEIEAPVRAAWKGIKVISAPVSVYYPPPEERVSHFRPFKDFVRISILNTFLTFYALLWIHPRNFFLKLFNKEARRKIWLEVFVKPEESNLRKAISLGFGVFMGIVPIWGFQLLVGIPLAIFFRLNKALFLIAANVSIFPLTPFVWALSLLVGKLVLGYEDLEFNISKMSLEEFKEIGAAFFLGGTVLAVASGLIVFLLSYLVLYYTRKK